MKSSEPIRGKINTFRWYDWSKTRSLSFRPQHPRGDTGLHSGSRWPTCRILDTPLKDLAVLLAKPGARTPPCSTPIPPSLVFPSEGKGNIPLASSVGSRRQSRRCRCFVLWGSARTQIRYCVLTAPKTRKAQTVRRETCKAEAPTSVDTSLLPSRAPRTRVRLRPPSFHPEEPLRSVCEGCTVNEFIITLSASRP